jgi:hypothetical protein
MKSWSRVLCCSVVLTSFYPMACGYAEDFTDVLRPTEWRFVKGKQAIVGVDRRLGSGLEALQRASRQQLNILTGASGQSVASIDLDVPSPPSSSFERRALTFLGARLPALTHSVAIDELFQKELPYVCEVAPSYKGKSGRTLFFERVIDRKPVIGGAITVRMEGDGSVVSVFNSLAPVAAKALRWDDVKVLLENPTLADTKRTPVTQILPDARRREAALKIAKPVWIPVRSRTLEGLIEAKHLTWANSQGELMSGFVLPDNTLLSPTIVPATRKDKKVPLAYIDGKKTGLPTFISYRSRGGYPVSPIGVFENPAEIAFRYLEENPEVFRTGQARCQFDVLDIRKSSVSPLLTFVKLGQVIAGRRVYGAELIFEIEDGHRIQTIQGHTVAHAKMPLVPQIDGDQAKTVALGRIDAGLHHQPASVRNKVKESGAAAQLVIFPGEVVAQKGLAKPLQSRLAYHTQTLLHGLFVDAVTGEVLYGYSRLHRANIVREAAGRTIVEKPFFTEVSRDGVTSTPGVALSPAAAAATTSLAAVSTFYAAHGWIGTDGRGSDLVANVNVNLFTCPNAFSPPVDEESYFCAGEMVPDVLAHELTHGVIWNSSDLTYVDESGALNESYADIMGNIAFPDVVVPPATTPGWLVGEGSAAAAIGSIRNMANPLASLPPQPASYALYLSRTDLGCSPLDLPGITCDFGGVHSNSGITSLAHVLMSDGGLGGLVGMGRARVRSLAFDVMTLRLSRWSRLVDSAIATKASCETMFSLNALDVTGTVPFRQIDCDQIPGSFATVGLDPDLVTDWIPPAVGFTGLVTKSAGETTDNGCTITDLILQMNSPGGLLESQATLVLPGGAPLTVSYFGVDTATIAATAPPIGGITKTHIIKWASAFGDMPQLNSALVAPPPPGASNCLGFAVTETKDSAPAVSPGIPLIGGAGTLVTGNAASNMNVACTLTGTEVQLIDGSGNEISDAGPTAAWSEVVWIAFVPVTLTRTAVVTVAPPGATPGGPGNFNLAGSVAWAYSAGVTETRWKLVYHIGKPAGTTCTP